MLFSKLQKVAYLVVDIAASRKKSVKQGNVQKINEKPLFW